MAIRILWVNNLLVTLTCSPCCCTSSKKMLWVHYVCTYAFGIGVLLVLFMAQEVFNQICRIKHAPYIKEFCVNNHKHWCMDIIINFVLHGWGWVITTTNDLRKNIIYTKIFAIEIFYLCHLSLNFTKSHSNFLKLV